MEHPFFPTTTTRAEALRWLTIAEKLLSTRDLNGSRSFAGRAREADPTLSQADQIIAVVDTLLAGDRRIGNNQQDLYAILRLTPPQGVDRDLIASQYRSLALLLNPQKNKFPFAEQAFRLVLEAWSVLSDPSRKMMYDRELSFYLQPQQEQPPQHIDQFGNSLPGMHQNFNFFGGSSTSNSVAQPSQPQPSTSSSAAVFPQVQVSSSIPQVDPLAGGSSREPPRFMNFTSGSNIVFGSGSGSVPGSNPGRETVHKPAQEGYPHVGGDVAPGPATNTEHQQPQENYSNVGSKVSHNVDERVEEEEEDMEGVTVEEEDEDGMDNADYESTVWTACPYCYYMYEYPGVYADCVLRCQNCKSAFQAVAIPSPPPILNGQDGYFCCWGFLPLGFSMENWEKNKGAASTWTPFSPMFTCPPPFGKGGKSARPRSSAPRVYIDDDEVFMDLPDSSGSDDDWNGNKQKRKKQTKSTRGKGAAGPTPVRNAKKTNQVDKGKNVDVQEDGLAPPQRAAETANELEGSDLRKKGLANGRKQPGRAAKNFGKLDLNVECSNEGEETGPRVNQSNRGEDENIEGNGFFEGLDEFLNSLPILNAVGEDKVVKA